MVMASTLMMIISMTYRIPYAANAAIYALTISRQSPQATLNSIRTTFVALAVASDGFFLFFLDGRAILATHSAFNWDFSGVAMSGAVSIVEKLPVEKEVTIGGNPEAPHELFNPEAELLAVTVSPRDKRTDPAGDDCKQVCPVLVSKTVIGKPPRLTTFPEAQGNTQLAPEVFQRVR
jgi:hypothetical protein